MAMHDFMSSFTLAQLAGLLFGLWLLYAAQLGVRRLYFSPISHIPGPRLAALTQYYEFYYDIVLRGQYTFKIIEMHREYGPVVRISPWEVHVGDPEFFPELYTGPGRPREKWAFYTQQFGSPGKLSRVWCLSTELNATKESALATINHEHHRLRRSALNPFFSTQSVRKLQPVIEERVDALLGRLLDHGQRAKEPLDVMYPFSAFTNDVINQYSFARSDHLIEDRNFGKEVTDNLLVGTHLGPMIKHMNWALTLVNALPESFSGRFVPGWGGFLKMKNDIKDQIAEIKRTENTDKWQLDVSHPTIFHEMLSSRLLPPREKTVSRLGQDGQILVQGGTLTTSWTLSLAVFHLLNRPSTLRRLRDELFAAIPDRDAVVPLAELENLPYLRGVVKESLGLGFGTSSRLARVCPDETLSYHDKERGRTLRLPPGTVIGMSTYKTQTDPTIYHDPFGFHPERWIEDGERLEKYLTVFCGGTRVCLGMALAQAELYLMLAKLFRRWGGGGVVGGSAKGDGRPSDVGVLRIFDTTVRDCEMAADYFIPIPYKNSKGIRIVFDSLHSAVV
ncbi:N-acetyltryptophan 6-hydroxylase ivoC [Colletotrichum shisoi]|uniref:N-acetyltryptophan 6-hydroxylase ivoC n=1 Tax=Colletotrichum shisoi TaxID=2078593 RepID=A0A5Q4BYC0_9PEZI|nr:N-acetyltryptophan 6-hydroxylase ivoC [Colletotrichum shisoi]